MRIRAIIFIETNSTFSAAAPFVRTLGFAPILFTRMRMFAPNYYDPIELNVFENIYDVNTHDSNAMYSLTKILNFDIKGVLSCYDDNVLSAAYLAEKLSLPYPNFTGLRNTYYKDKVREILAYNRIRQPRHIAFSLDNIPHISPFNYPFVIKPAHDCGADGVYLCKSPAHYQMLIEYFKTKPYTFSGLQRNRIILEEFIEGNFYGAELIWYKGAWYVVGINQLFIDPAKSLCITGISFPADIPKYILGKVKASLIRWVNCLNLQGGALNIEFKLVNNQPVLIEINPRLAGSKVNKLIELKLGFSPIEYLIKQACGLEHELTSLQEITPLYFADAFVFPSKSGLINNVNYPSTNNPHLIEMEFKTTPTFISSNTRIFDNIFGHVIASGEDCENAMYNAQTLSQAIEFS